MSLEDYFGGVSQDFAEAAPALAHRGFALAAVIRGPKAEPGSSSRQKAGSKECIRVYTCYIEDISSGMYVLVYTLIHTMIYPHPHRLPSPYVYFWPSPYVFLAITLCIFLAITLCISCHHLMYLMYFLHFLAITLCMFLPAATTAPAPLLPLSFLLGMVKVEAKGFGVVSQLAARLPMARKGLQTVPSGLSMDSAIILHAPKALTTMVCGVWAKSHMKKSRSLAKKRLTNI